MAEKALRCQRAAERAAEEAEAEAEAETEEEAARARAGLLNLQKAEDTAEHAAAACSAVSQNFNASEPSA